jgi:DNA primase large subunit
MTKEIQMTSIRFTKNDMAKYPFLKENAEHIRKLDLKIEDLASAELSAALERAEERVEESILYAIVDRKTRNEEIEILSFPAAIMLVIATGNSFIGKRYALAEAKRAYEDLKNENARRILEIAENLGWKLAVNPHVGSQYEFSVNFTDYLRNATHLRDRKWKLVNRVLAGGKVFLSRNETARLLSEEVRRNIEKRFEVDDLPVLPKKIIEIAEKMKRLSADKIGRTETEKVPQVMVESAFPPCISALYLAFSSGRHMSHIGRFALTSFLVNIGMPAEKVIELFKNISDFNERMTRYQVEHIAGETGSRTRYIPPKCDTLKTHGVCTNPDELCRRVRHPLGYYRIRLGRERKSR